MGTRRILFIAEAVTLAHVGRMYALAASLDRRKYTPLLAWHPRYNRLLGEIRDEFYPLESINTGQFLERLRAAEPVYDFRTMEVYAAWEPEFFRDLTRDRPVVYLNLGTSGNPDLVPRILEVLSRRAVTVIAGGGGRAEAAVLAPSAGNCQPWRYRWTGDHLEISIVPERSNPFLNFVNVDTWVSLGAVLTNLRVAAAAGGFDMEHRLFPSDSRYGLVARVRWKQGDGTHSRFAEAVETRCTNRRNYADRQIPVEIRDQLVTAIMGGDTDVRLDLVDEASQRSRVAGSPTARSVRLPLESVFEVAEPN